MVGIVLSMNTCDASSKITMSNMFLIRGRKVDTFSGERSQQGNSARTKSLYTSIVLRMGQYFCFFEI